MTSKLGWDSIPKDLKPRDFILGAGLDTDHQTNDIFKGFLKKIDKNLYYVKPCWRAINYKNDIGQKLENNSNKIWDMDEWDYVKRELCFDVAKVTKLDTIPIEMLKTLKDSEIEKTFEIINTVDMKKEIYKGKIISLDPSGTGLCGIVYKSFFGRKTNQVSVQIAAIRNIK